MAIREGFHTVTPYLTAPDADTLVEFMKRGLGGTETHRSTGGQGGFHIEVKIGDSMIMVGQRAGAPTTAMLFLYVDDVDAWHSRALEAGATSIMPPADAADGDRRGGVRDACGNVWFFGKPKG